MTLPILLQNEAPTVEVLVQDSPLAVLGALAAVIVAGVAAFVTWRQGRAIHRIEAREHEWQNEDRLSAHIEVTRQVKQRARGRTSDSSFGVSWDTETTLRFKNTGRHSAENVEWEFATDRWPDRMSDRTRESPTFKETNWSDAVINTTQRTIDVLHPGEAVSFHMTHLVIGRPEFFDIKVSWTDGREGRQEKTSTVNW